MCGEVLGKVDKCVWEGAGERVDGGGGILIGPSTVSFPVLLSSLHLLTADTPDKCVWEGAGKELMGGNSDWAKYCLFSCVALFSSPSNCRHSSMQNSKSSTRESIMPLLSYRTSVRHSV